MANRLLSNISIKQGSTWLVCCFILVLISSCAPTPQVKFQVTKPAQLHIEKVKAVTIGTFTDQTGQKIVLPKGVKEENTPGKLNKLRANRSTADLVRAQLVTFLSQSGEYQLLNTSGRSEKFSGAVPEPAMTAVINARVKYYEFIKESKDQVAFVLLAKNNNVPLQTKVLIAGMEELAIKKAEKSGKGFKVPVPYTEALAAIEVEFDMIRKSDGKRIIPTQTVREYFTKKWGGNPGQSIVAPKLRKAILSKQNNPSLMDELRRVNADLRQQTNDPYEYIASGKNLKQNATVPLLPLDLRKKLIEKVAWKYSKKISRYHEEAKLVLDTGGNATGINLIKGNAYEEAINYLESLSKPLSPADTYNLALAYESVGEFPQAEKYYKIGLEKTGAGRFKAGLKRIKR